MQEKDPDAGVECFGHKKKRLKQNKMKNSNCNLRVAFDCSFDDLMGEKGKWTNETRAYQVSFVRPE